MAVRIIDLHCDGLFGHWGNSFPVCKRQSSTRGITVMEAIVDTVACNNAGQKGDAVRLERQPILLRGATQSSDALALCVGGGSP